MTAYIDPVLTAQEAFEQEGFVLFYSDTQFALGAVVHTNVDGGVLPLGTQLVIAGCITFDEAVQYCGRVGWSIERFDLAKHFYRAVAE